MVFSIIYIFISHYYVTSGTALELKSASPWNCQYSRQCRGREVMTKHWDCKLMFKEEEDTPEIDLLDYVNFTEQEEDKIPNNPSYPNFLSIQIP
jgi:hypothetical protein